MPVLYFPYYFLAYMLVGVVWLTILHRRDNTVMAAIEADLACLVSDNLSLDDAALTALCEQLIRSYDPCISCSAHFLTLTVDRN